MWIGISSRVLAAGQAGWRRVQCGRCEIRRLESGVGAGGGFSSLATAASMAGVRQPGTGHCGMECRTLCCCCGPRRRYASLHTNWAAAVRPHTSPSQLRHLLAIVQLSCRPETDENVHKKTTKRAFMKTFPILNNIKNGRDGNYIENRLKQ